MANVIDDYIGPYRILRLIDRGGQGNVHLGYDTRLKRQVAIKIQRMPGARAARRRVMREARLVAAMECPKVVPVYDVIASSNYLAMVMEYVPGCSLEDLLQSVRPSLPSVMSVGIDIAGALAAAREHHVVHGDVKAANVLIGSDGRARLADFGIARHLERDVGGERAGSLEALSPEQLAGEPVGEQADLFALGALLYRMLCGRHPYLLGERLDSERLRRGQPLPLAELPGGRTGIPAELLRLVEQLMHPDPRRRPRNTRLARQVMRDILREEYKGARNELLAQARPLFRRELPEDIPPQVPAELGRSGRSHLPPAGGYRVRLRHWLGELHRPARAGLAVALVSALCAPLVVALHNEPTVVQLQRPLMKFATDIEMPAGFSAYWLAQEVQLALARELGELRVSPGAESVHTRYYVGASAPAVDDPVDHDLTVALRCLDDFCVLDLVRVGSERTEAAQRVLLPREGIRQWRSAVHTGVGELF